MAGSLFIHIFVHRLYAYTFAAVGEENWMGRYFFTGGIMPSDRSPYCFPDHLRVADHWRWAGKHYAATADAWLAKLDAHRSPLLELFQRTQPASDAARQLVRWRLFFLACSELFGFQGGTQWWVSHYLLRPERPS